LRDHIVDWFSQPRDAVRFALTHDGILMQPGDIFMIDHPRLKPSQRPNAVTALTSGITDSATTWNVTAGTAGLLRANDWVYLQTDAKTEPEACQIASVDAPSNQVTVTRGELNTTARAHNSAQSIYHLTTKWFCTGVQPMTRNRPYITVQAEEVPPWYFRVGVVVAAGYDNYIDASAEDQAIAGWATLRNGRVADEDAGSEISHVGPSTA
jgi:hypothetical protein